MRECRTYGSVRGALSNGRSYRDTLVFCIAISAYVTPALMGPSGSRYAPIVVYQQFISAFNWPRGTAVATVLLVITAAALMLFLGRANRRPRNATAG